MDAIKKCAILVGIFCLITIGIYIKVELHKKQGFISPEEISELKYTIEPIITGNTAKLSIELEIKLKNSNHSQILLQLPREFGGAFELYKEVNNLISLTPGTAVHATDRPDRKIIDHVTDNIVKISYDLVSTITGAHQINDSTSHRAIITPQYFHAVGYALFVHPALKKDTFYDSRTHISLNWKNIPSHWTLANSHGASIYEQQLTISIEQLYKAIYIAGDFRSTPHGHTDTPVYIAIRGNWLPEVENKFRDTLARIIQAEREFWNDFDDPYYLVTIIPWDEIGHGGTGLTNSYCLFMNEKKEINPSVIWTISHENFHHWLGHKIKIYDNIKWFHEGFTDYYGMQIALRAKLISFTEYVDLYNNILYAYYTSHARNLPNNKICDNFWCDYEVQKLPYQRGNILAHNWNAEIKTKTNNTASLDNVMLDIFKKVKEKQHFTISLFQAIMRSYHINTIEQDIQKYNTEGHTITPSPEAFGNQCTLIWTPDKEDQKLLIPSYKISSQ